MHRELLWALRWLRKSPLFTAAVIAILALGIGATTAVFSIVDAVLLQPMPYLFADRLVRVEESNTRRTILAVPVEDYRRWSGRGDIFDEVAPYLRDTVTLTGSPEPEQVVAVRTLGLFPLLGARAQLGRTLVADDDERGTRNVAVLSDRLWRRRFHADPGVVGRAIDISGEMYTVAGVMPPDFEFRYPEAEIWTPLRLTASSPWLQVAARLKAGVSVARARSALEIVAHQMELEAPMDRAGLKIAVTPWSDTPDDKYRLTLILVLAAVGLVLLIACADVGSLLLGRAVQRQKEIAIRASLGAGLWRVAWQLLAEGLVLAVAGSLAGIGLARLLLQVLARQLAALPIVLPHLARVALNSRVLVFNTILCLLLAALCSLAGVLLSARTDIEAVLRGGQAVSGPRGYSRLFSALIASQAAFAFLLLLGSGLMVRSLVRLQQEDHGFRPGHVLTLRVPVGTFTQPRPTGRYDTRTRQMAYYREILEHVKTVPGIRAAAIVNNLPLSGVNSATNVRGPDGQPVLISTRTISPQYFSAMGIPLVTGRIFSDGDRSDTPRVAIINEYLAHQLFPDRNPLGQLLPEPGSNAHGAMVVGVVKDTSQMSYELPAKGEIYIPYQQFIFAAFMSTIVVRTSGDPMALAATIRKEVWAVDPAQPVVRVETMEDVVANSIWRPRFSAWIFSVLGGLSLLLTATGIYGVVAYTSSLRAREVGIRVALGATLGKVVAVILRGAMVPLLLGLCLGAVAAFWLSRLLADLLYKVSGSDALTYVSVGVLLLAVGAIASARPAWRAATRDPLRTLRSE